MKFKIGAVLKRKRASFFEPFVENENINFIIIIGIEKQFYKYRHRGTTVGVWENTGPVLERYFEEISQEEWMIARISHGI
jgi:hypothetical protein